MKKLPALVLLAPLALLTCSRGPTSPNTRAASSVADSDGASHASAVGDVKNGPGALEIFNVRLDRQNAATGASIFRQYANPGGVYTIAPGERIELWVEYRGANNPRVRVDWGANQVDRFDGHVCGSCLLTHVYPEVGTWTVVVTLDDQAGTTVSRTFVLNALVESAATLNVAFIGGAYCGGVATLSAPGGISCKTPGGGTCSANFPAGTTVTITFSATGCTGFAGWVGACAVPTLRTSTLGFAPPPPQCTLTLPPGVTTISARTVNDD